MKVEEEIPVSQVLQLAPTLVPDSTSECCMACRKAFSLFFRRHHCRFCGRLLCGSCTAARVEVDSRKLRTCEKCLDTYTKKLQATREQRLLQQKQRELRQERRQESVLPPELKEEKEQKKEAREQKGTHKEQITDVEEKEEKQEVEVGAETVESGNGSGRDSLRGRSFEQATSTGKKASAGRPRRSNSMLPSDKKSATMQPTASSGAKKASYRKSLRSARSERQLKNAASFSFSASPESEPVVASESQNEERMSSGLQTADGSLARLTEEDGRVSTVGAVSVTTTTPATEGESVAVSGETSSLPNVDVIGMLPDIAAGAAAAAAAAVATTTATATEPLHPAADALEEGCTVLYVGKDGVPQRATVLKAHFDDYPHLYYTIRLDESGRERQTDAARLQRVGT
jgi:hypothetical protein